MISTNDLSSANLFVATSRVPANTAFLVFLMFFFEFPIQMTLFRIHLHGISNNVCYLSSLFSHEWISARDHHLLR